MYKKFINKSLRIFSISLAITFIMGITPYLGFKFQSAGPYFTNPAPAADVLDKLKRKLEAKPNTFRLNKDLLGGRNLIPVAAAGVGYDQAKAFVLVNIENGEILASKNLSEVLKIASLTKIMTAAVALDLADPEEQFIVSGQAASQVPTKVMLKAGEKYKLGELLKSLLITSANDSAEVIKEGIDRKYGEGVFIKAMNHKAKFLGLKNTSFTNPQGYDSGNHYSSAEDLSILSVYALKEYPLIAEIVSKDFEDLTKGGRDLRFYLNNWNGLLGVYPGVSGLKTGNTGQAGQCTIVTAERAGKKLLAVLLGAPGVLQRDLWTAELLDLGFNKMADLPSVGVTENMLKEKYASWKYFE